ncbi:MAG: threonine-phosphate decarboxylase CobD [Thiohalomonadales bacterium]
MANNAGTAQEIRPMSNKHGGQLLAAAKKYQIPLADWLDLSTGINPNPWPVPAIPEACWQRLPDDNDDLLQAAQHYYQCQSLLPLPGSQAAIQILPQLRPHCRVLIRSNSYSEHAKNWAAAGHAVTEADPMQFSSQINQHEVVVVINPDNPSGDLIATETLLAWRELLHARGGWLIVDEAFVDVQPEASLSRHAPLAGLIILRSLGKFFGLAGIRAGFIIAPQDILASINEYLGPWPLSHPSRWLSSRALRDSAWQSQTLLTLAVKAQRLKTIISNISERHLCGTSLFQTLRVTKAEKVHTFLAQQGILTRLLDDHSGIRFGLAGSELAEQRLRTAISHIHRI